MTTMKILMVLMVVLFTFWKIFYIKYMNQGKKPIHEASKANQKTIEVEEIHNGETIKSP